MSINSCTNAWACILNDRTPDCHGCMDDLTTERSFNSQTSLVIDETRYCRRPLD